MVIHCSSRVCVLPSLRSSHLAPHLAPCNDIFFPTWPPHYALHLLPKLSALLEGDWREDFVAKDDVLENPFDALSYKVLPPPILPHPNAKDPAHNDERTLNEEPSRLRDDLAPIVDETLNQILR